MMHFYLTSQLLVPLGFLIYRQTRWICNLYALPIPVSFPLLGLYRVNCSTYSHTQAKSCGLDENRVAHEIAKISQYRGRDVLWKNPLRPYLVVLVDLDCNDVEYMK